MSERGIPCVADSGTSSMFGQDTVLLALDCILYAFGHKGYLHNEVPDPEDLANRYQKAVASGDASGFAEGLEAVRQRANAVSSKGYGLLGGRGLQEFYHRVLNAMGMERGVLSETDMHGLAVLSRVIGDYEYVYRSLRAKQVAGLKWFVKMFVGSNYGDKAHEDPGLADAVRILTLWKAKGLEFPAVFMPSFEKRRDRRPPELFVDDHLYDGDMYSGDDEYDRRACYVAVTRSQKYLFVTGASFRKISVNSPPPRTARTPHPFALEMHGREFSDAPDIRRQDAVAPALPRHTGAIPSSFSELSLYDRCPHEYMLRHIVGFSAGVSSALGYGTNICNILNRIHSDYIRNGLVPTKDAISNMFDELFYMRFAPGARSNNMKKTGIRVVENYVKAYGADFGRILETEKRFEFAMGGALISGSIDLLKKIDEDGRVDRLEIIDFETDKSVDYRPDRREQVRFYAHAVRESLGHLPGRATVHYLDTEKTEDVDIEAVDLERTRAGIIKKIDMIRTRKFRPAPEEPKCSRCDFQAICAHKGFEVGPDFDTAPRRKR